jgi:hypothetical protein
MPATGTLPLTWTCINARPNRPPFSAPQFAGSREATLLEACAEALAQADEKAFATAVAEFDSLTRLDAWKVGFRGVFGACVGAGGCGLCSGWGRGMCGGEVGGGERFGVPRILRLASLVQQPR